MMIQFLLVLPVQFPAVHFLHAHATVIHVQLLKQKEKPTLLLNHQGLLG